MSAFLLFALQAVPGFAQDAGAEDVDADRQDTSLLGQVSTLSPLSPPATASGSAGPVGPPAPPASSLPYSAEVYVGAKVLDMPAAFVAGIQQGLELVYLRKYDEALAHFRELDKAQPSPTGIAEVADTVIWQARMLENFDYRYDKEYWNSSKEAKAAVYASLERPGQDAWDHLLLAGVLGVEAIHTMRQSHYLSALRLAFQAMDHIGRSRAAAPDFIDLQLADGLYNYWRTVVTMSSSMLPDFGDHRARGIEQMARVEREGVFMGPMATLSLAFTWMEEKDWNKAAAACEKNRKAYPDNVINNLVTGMVQIYRRKYQDAIAAFDHVHRVDPSNDRAHYWRGVALMRKGDLDAAKRELHTYLGSEHLEKSQLAYVHYRLGQAHAKAEEYAEAVDFYAKAAKIDGHKGAKRALSRLKERKKAGKIDY